MTEKIRRVRWVQLDLGEEEKKALADCIDRGWIAGGGPATQELERTVKRLVDVKHAVACSSGTTALMTALYAVIPDARRAAIPTFTFVATVNVTRNLIEPVLVDCDPATLNLSLKDLSAVQWDCVIPVHVGGLPVDMAEVVETAEKRNGWVIEDAAEAIGAQYRGKPVGSLGDLACFSLYASKVVASGEGGFITTNSDELAEKCRQIINQGYAPRNEEAPWEYLHSSFGLNFRITDLQAAVAVEQLKKLPRFLERRSRIASIYREMLNGKVGFQQVPPDRTHPYYLFLILVEEPKRDKVIRRLTERGIEAKVTWRPVHLQPFYRHDGRPLPNAEHAWRQVIALPIHNKMSEEDAVYVSDQLLNILVS